MSSSDLTDLLDRISAGGAEVRTAKGKTSATDVQRAEEALGFAIPDELREFFVDVGEAKVVLERTWNFYGLDEALAKTDAYRRTFDRSRGDYAGDADAYFPSRFLVVHDEGDFDNEASGTVYDADLGAFLKTNGFRPVRRDEAFEVGYWGHLLDELDAVRERIEDPEDVLVAGSARDLAKQKAGRDAGAGNPRAAKAIEARRAAMDRLHAAFRHHALPKERGGCLMGAGCEACRTLNAKLADGAARDLSAKDLFHLGYMRMIQPGGAEEELMHLLPTLLARLDDVAAQGNPPVVIKQLMTQLCRLRTTEPENAAIEEALLAHWDTLLTNTAIATTDIGGFLQAMTARFVTIAPFLDAWTKRLDEPEARAHLEAYAGAVEAERGAAYYGWTDAPFAELTAWLEARRGSSPGD